MESVVQYLLEAVRQGGPGTLAVLGWGMYLLERFIVHRNREKRHREDLKMLRSDYENLSKNTVETIQKFITILEVLKDRGDRS